MVFSSLTFLFLFLPIAVLLYFIVPGIKAKNGVLLAASLLFYAWGEPLYLFLMIALSLLNWSIGLLMQRGCRRLLLALAVVLDLGGLVFFKYAGFLTENFNAITGLNVLVPKLALPIGISFYTFQILSYVVDVYRKKVPVQFSFFRFLLYVSLFPQLIAGPIVRYKDVEPQLSERPVELENVFYGFFRFCIGLAKKVLIADFAGSTASKLLDGNFAAQTTVGAWFGVLMFMFEIYFDFSGYSDMAIGLGRIFGFRYSENFNLPYTAVSITDFWRRWHISLSTFFRDYVYIPLGGNRRHMYLNLFITWTLTGLWHGASWNFVIWGVYFFVLLAFEKLLKKPLSKIPNGIRRIFTLILILIGWNVFYQTDLSRLLDSFRVMFGALGSAAYDQQTGIVLLNSLPLLVLCVIGSTPLPRSFGNALSMLCATNEKPGLRQFVYIILMFLFAAVLLCLSVIALIGSSFNAFLYFRF